MLQIILLIVIAVSLLGNFILNLTRVLKHSRFDKDRKKLFSALQDQVEQKKDTPTTEDEAIDKENEEIDKENAEVDKENSEVAEHNKGVDKKLEGSQPGALPCLECGIGLELDPAKGEPYLVECQDCGSAFEVAEGVLTPID